MSKPLYQEITTEVLHSTATMVAAGHRHGTIMMKLGVSLAGMRRIQERADWASILASKEAAIARMMTGDA
ncbi:hypothetical protein ASF00_09225 [Sphingomonas sp. Leaf34]|uniref:hypothetical protein n=1 Tax=Sphingomonas sp. Leaf34 TaxID=1736216 RepID=UPI0006FF5964|nr:hypothetical protein [Sphingomonas sp. Leaf34]KQN28079.1 hypothetical protein ASF00_09225 [Sphingomonas sp. Leaf34]